MVRPAFWKGAGEADMEALFKRAVFVLMTSKWVYVQPATEREVPCV